MKPMEGFMRGINLGGWVSQFDRGDKEHFDTFITEEDICRIARMHYDHVRVPVDYTMLEEEDGTPKEDGFRYLDNCVRWCRELGLHMIIDLHKTFGYSFDPLDKDDKTAFFYDDSKQARFFALWERIAKRYSGESDYVAYELLNEIVMPEVAKPWNGIALEAIRRIRVFAPVSWIIFGGVNYNSVTAVPLLPERVDERTAFTFHCYEPLIFTHQGAYWVNRMPADFRIGYPKSLEEYREASRMLDRELVGAIYDESLPEIGPAYFEALFAPALKTSMERDVPLYCGEYGVIDLAAHEDRDRWLADIHEVFAKYKIGCAQWNYKEKDFGIV